MHLSDIIRPVQPAARKGPAPSGFQRITVDPGKQTAATKVPLFGGGKYKYYDVAEAGESILPAENFHVTDDRGHTRLWSCRVSVSGCDKPGELALATARHGENAAAALWEVLHKAINSAILQLCAKDANPVTKPSDETFAEIRGSVKDKLDSQLGLKIKSLSLRSAVVIPKGGVDHLATEEFQVRLNESDEILQLVLEVVLTYPLKPAEREALAGTMPDRDDLIATFQGIAQTYLTDHVKLQQFCYHRATVKTGLESALKEVVPEGLSLLRANLDWKNPFPLTFITELEKTVNCRAQNQIPMQIHHILRITQGDIALWRKAQAADPRAQEGLPTWIEDRLQGITSRIVGEKSYVEIMTAFSTVQEDIKNAFAGEFEAIGFTAVQLISHTQDRELEIILQHRSVDVTTGDEEYDTSDGRVKFGLRIAARIGFAIEKVKQLVVPGGNFKAKFVQALKAGAEQAIRKLSPEELYAAFHDTDRKTKPQGKQRVVDVPTPDAANELIREKIREELKAFCEDQDKSWQETQIDLTAIPTPLYRIYGGIEAHSPAELRLEVETANERGGETIPINIKYTLEIAPDGWSRFQKVCSSLLEALKGTAPLPTDGERELAVVREILAKVASLIKLNAESALSGFALKHFIMPTSATNRRAEALAFFGPSEALDAALEANEPPKPSEDSAIQRVLSGFGLLTRSSGFKILPSPTLDRLRERWGKRQDKLDELEDTYADKRVAIAGTVAPNDPLHDELKGRVAGVQDEQQQSMLNLPAPASPRKRAEDEDDDLNRPVGFINDSEDEP